jgi:hypothetical protein
MTTSVLNQQLMHRSCSNLLKLLMDLPSVGWVQSNFQKCVTMILKCHNTNFDLQLWF